MITTRGHARSNRQYYSIPVVNVGTSKEIVILPFHRVPKTKNEIETFERGRAAVPEVNSSNDTVMKKISGYFHHQVLSKSRYMHCEIVFKKSMFVGASSAPNTAVAYLVQRTKRDGSPGGVEKRERTFMSKCYDYIFLRVPKKMAWKMAKLCESTVGRPFDSNGSKGIYTIAEDFDGSKFFCVSHVMHILSVGGVIKGYEDSIMRTTVDELYDIMKRNKYKAKLELIPYEEHVISKATIDDVIPVVTNPPRSSKKKGSAAARRKKHKKNVKNRPTITKGVFMPEV